MPRLVSIDLGAHQVKVAVFEQASRRLTPQETLSVPVPQSHEEPPQFASRLLALEALLDEHANWKNPNTTVIAGWPSQQASTHRLSLPFTDKAQLEQTLPFAVEAEVPFDMEDMGLSWRVLSQAGGSQVLVGLSRGEQVGDALAALQGRGLDPAAMPLDGDVAGALAPGGVVAWIDVGHVRTLVSLVVDGVVQATRAVDVGGRDFTLAIQEALACSYSAAEHVKHSGQLPEAPPASAVEEDDQDEPTDSELHFFDDVVTNVPVQGEEGPPLPARVRRQVDAQVGLLLAGIRSTLIAFEDDTGREVEQVVLCGGGSRLNGLRGYLTEDLGVKVQRVTDPDGNVLAPEWGMANALAYAHVSGTDLLDVRVGEHVFKGGTDALVMVARYGGLFVALFVLANLALFGVRYYQFSQQEGALRADITQLIKGGFPGVSETQLQSLEVSESLVRTELTAAQERAAVLGEGSGVPPTVQMLADLTEAFPPADEVTVDVSDLQISQSVVTFTAETDGYASSAAVVESLQQNARFASAEKGKETKARDKLTFSVRIDLDGEEG